LGNSSLLVHSLLSQFCGSDPQRPRVLTSCQGASNCASNGNAIETRRNYHLAFRRIGSGFDLANNILCFFNERHDSSFAVRIQIPLCMEYNMTELSLLSLIARFNIMRILENLRIKKNTVSLAYRIYYSTSLAIKRLIVLRLASKLYLSFPMLVSNISYTG